MHRPVMLAFVLLASCSFSLAAQPLEVPIGVTELLTDATATVGYQYFDKGTEILGHGWTGYDGGSGVYFQPEPSTIDTTRFFMHCPWRGGEGIAFAEYDLALPAADRIRLTFEIGIRSSAENTDGVTYRINVGDSTLFDRHCRWKEMRPFEVDLSEFAASTVTLRLVVHPGPENDTTDDWSLWGDVRLLGGTDAQIQQAEARQKAQEQRRKRAAIRKGKKLAQVSLRPLTQHHNESICPGVLQETQVDVRKQGDEYVFTCRGDETIEYRLDPREGVLAGLNVAVERPDPEDGATEHIRLDPPPFRGGPQIVLDDRRVSAPTDQIDVALESAELNGTALICRYAYTNPDTGSSAHLTAAFSARNKSLIVEVTGEPNRFSGFTASPNGGRAVATSFAPGGPPRRRHEGVYVSTVADLMRSESSYVRQNGVSYHPLTNGVRNAMHDYFYLTVSSRYEETLSNVSHRPSPYLNDLAQRLVLDVWGGAFANDEQWLSDMSRYGLDSFLIIKHVWQRDGYDRSYPNTMPANAQMGGDEDLRSLSLAAQQLGHRFCVHENYYDYYPNAEDFHPHHRAVNSAGVPLTGWDRGPVTAAILKPSLLMQYARQFSPQIKRRYDCNAAYHDIMPTWRVDYDADVEGAGKIRLTHEYTRQLCDYDHKLFDGPVVFEAATAPMAGVYDGGCNHGLDTYRTPTAVAFEILKVHPKMSNHGFGYYERWLPWGYGPGWPSYVMTDRELDKYRAYQVAFGRTGFIGQQLMKHHHALVREYYLMGAFGRAYTGKLAELLRYQIDGHWVDAGTAGRYNDFDRLNIQYENQQQVYVNLASEPMQVEGHVLPQFGALTIGPRSTAWTAIRDGQICDYAAYDDVVYCDARSHTWQPAQQQPPIHASVAEFEDLGDGKFSLTVNWTPERKLDRNYTIFWHFRDDQRIVFQRDHRPQTPTTQWPVGETYTDGPLTLTIKPEYQADDYDIVVGLYDNQGRPKLTAGMDEVAIGAITVHKEDGAIDTIEFAEKPESHMPGSDPERYLEGANLDSDIIDFGRLATNGAVIIRGLPEADEIIPVPIGDEMTVGISAAGVRGITQHKSDGAVAPVPDASPGDGKLWFRTAADAVKYSIQH